MFSRSGGWGPLPGPRGQWGHSWDLGDIHNHRCNAIQHRRRRRTRVRSCFRGCSPCYARCLTTSDTLRFGLSLSARFGVNKNRPLSNRSAASRGTPSPNDPPTRLPGARNAEIGDWNSAIGMVNSRPGRFVADIGCLQAVQRWARGMVRAAETTKRAGAGAGGHLHFWRGAIGGGLPPLPDGRGSEMTGRGAESRGHPWFTAVFSL